MQLTNQLLLIVHLLGFAVLIGTILFYRRSNNKIAIRAGLAQLVSGIALLAVVETINGPKVTTKLGVLVLILILLLVWRKKDWSVNQRVILGLLVVLNVCLAVVW